MAGTGEVMIQLFSCCMQQQPSPTRRRHQRLRIDRSMIGNPTNFVHTGLSLNSHLLSFFTSRSILGHIGSNDAELSSQHLNVIQSQMQSKGGYDINSIRMQVRCGVYSLNLLSSYLFLISASVLISASKIVVNQLRNAKQLPLRCLLTQHKSP